MPKARKTQDRTARLDAAVWVAAAFDALAAGGIDAVRVEPLAKALAITKGSFYWHFADRRALIDATLAAWRDGRIAAIRQEAGGRGEPAAVLREVAGLYIHRANVHGLAIELAIRSFARGDERAAKAVQSVDQERLGIVTRHFLDLGWSRSEAQARATLFYSYLFGQSLLDPEAVPQAARDRAIEALLAARPA